MSKLNEVQDALNGPWSDDFRKRVVAIREKLGYSLADLGAEMSFSGSFVHGLMNGKAGYHMATKHAARVLAAVQGMEVKAGLARVADVSGDRAPLTMGDHINALLKMGYSVELKPLSV